jgi:hypothetical protein
VSLPGSRRDHPAITGCLKELQEESNQSLDMARHINEQAGQYAKYAQDRLATSQRLCQESHRKSTVSIGGAAWLLSITMSLAVMAIIGTWAVLATALAL